MGFFFVSFFAFLKIVFDFFVFEWVCVLPIINFVLLLLVLVKIFFITVEFFLSV